MGQFNLQRLFGAVAGFCAMCAYWRFLLGGHRGGLSGVSRYLFEALLVFIVFGTGVWVRFGKGWRLVFVGTVIFFFCRVALKMIASGRL
jgi:hypothetical protein